MSFHSASNYRVYRESILELIDRKDFLNFQGDSDSVLIVSLLKKLFFLFTRVSEVEVSTCCPFS